MGETTEDDKKGSSLGKDVGIGAAALGGTGAVGAGAAALAHGKKDKDEDSDIQAGENKDKFSNAVDETKENIPNSS